MPPPPQGQYPYPLGMYEMPPVMSYGGQPPPPPNVGFSMPPFQPQGTLETHAPLHVTLPLPLICGYNDRGSPNGTTHGSSHGCRSSRSVHTRAGAAVPAYLPEMYQRESMAAAPTCSSHFV